MLERTSPPASVEQTTSKSKSKYLEGYSLAHITELGHTRDFLYLINQDNNSFKNKSSLRTNRHKISETHTPIISNGAPHEPRKIIPDSEINTSNHWQWIQYQGEHLRTLTSGEYSEHKDHLLINLRAIDINLAARPKHTEEIVFSNDEALITLELLSEYNIFTDPRFDHIRELALQVLNRSTGKLESWPFQDYLFYTKEQPHLQKWSAEHLAKYHQQHKQKLQTEIKRMIGIRKATDIPITPDHIHNLSTLGRKHHNAEERLLQIRTTKNIRTVKQAHGLSTTDTTKQIHSYTKQKTQATTEIHDYYRNAASLYDEYFTNNCDPYSEATFTLEEKREYTRRRINNFLTAVASKPELLQGLDPQQEIPWISGTIHPDTQANPVSTTYTLTDEQIDHLLTQPETRWLSYTYDPELATEQPFYHISYETHHLQTLVKSTLHQLLNTALHQHREHIEFLTQPLLEKPLTRTYMENIADQVSTHTIQYRNVEQRLRTFAESNAADIDDLLGPENHHNTVGWANPEYYPATRAVAISDGIYETIQKIPSITAVTKKYLPRVAFIAALGFGGYAADAPQKLYRSLENQQLSSIIQKISETISQVKDLIPELPNFNNEQESSSRTPITNPINFLTNPNQPRIDFPYKNEQLNVDLNNLTPLPIETTDHMTEPTSDHAFIYQINPKNQNQYIYKNDQSHQTLRPPIGYKFTKVFSNQPDIEAALTATGEIYFSGNNPTELSFLVEPDDIDPDTPDKETETQHATPYTPTPDTQHISQLTSKIQQYEYLAYGLPSDELQITSENLSDPTTAQHRLDVIKFAFYAYSQLDRVYDNSPQALDYRDFTSDQPYPYLQALLDHPDKGYECEFAAHAYVDWLTLHGYKAELVNVAPIIPVDNGMGVMREAHQTVRIIESDGTITYSDMTPSNNQTPEEYRRRSEISPQELQSFINKQHFLESINILEHLPEPKPAAVGVDDY